MRIAPLFLVLALFVVVVPITAAINEFTSVSVFYEGKTDITTTLSVKPNSMEKLTYLSQESEKVMSNLKYPLDVTTEIKIEKCQYDKKFGTMGYWIYATRGGRDIKINNPVWVYPPPYLAIISETYDEKENKISVTVKEDPEMAIKQFLMQYVGTLKTV